jgi:endonuclease-3
MVNSELLKGTCERLVRLYKPEPKRIDPTDCLIGAILSQNTSDNLGHIAFANLKERYNSWEEVLDAQLWEIESLIRVCGLSKVRSRKIKTIFREIKRKFGKVDISDARSWSAEKLFDFLISLDGIGPKSASIILAFGFGRDSFPVDTHVWRILRRVGIVPQGWSRERVYYEVEKLVPKAKIKAHLALVKHGREICMSKRPKCESCIILDICKRKF